MAYDIVVFEKVSAPEGSMGEIEVRYVCKNKVAGMIICKIASWELQSGRRWMMQDVSLGVVFSFEVLVSIADFLRQLNERGGKND